MNTNSNSPVSFDNISFAFMNSFHCGNGEFLDKLRKQAILDNVPIIRQETENLLKVLLRLCEPKHILEVVIEVFRVYVPAWRFAL